MQDRRPTDLARPGAVDADTHPGGGGQIAGGARHGQAAKRRGLHGQDRRRAVPDGAQERGQIG